MADDARMTVRLDPATRRKVERLAAREGISLNEALNQLLQRAPEKGKGERTPRRRRYRLKPRKVGFGFDIARAKILAGELADEETLAEMKARR